MSDTRQISEKYAEIGAELIATEPRLFDVRNSDVRILFLSSELEKVQNTKVVFAQCEKVPEKYKWAVPADFCIVVFEPNVEQFTDEQRLGLVDTERVISCDRREGGREYDGLPVVCREEVTLLQHNV